MPRRLRTATGGYVYHVLNRAVRRATLFRKEADYLAFENILAEAMDFQPMRLLSYCLMPNHWHLILWPRADGDLSKFLRWVTVTHTQRYHAHYGSAGTGPLYQGRFKSFPVQTGEYLLTACRYVERNPLRAGLVRKAEMWRWSSLGRLAEGLITPWLSDWPDGRPELLEWIKEVNRVTSEGQLQALRRSVERGTPFGNESWTKRTAERLDLQSTLRARGRPAGKRGRESLS